MFTANKTSYLLVFQQDYTLNQKFKYLIKMKTFIESEIEGYLAENLRDWRLEENALRRDFKFKTFVEAFSFMTAIALEAEKVDHHPDWTNSYNKVSIAFSTHSEKGITLLDYDLAGKTDELYKRYH